MTLGKEWSELHAHPYGLFYTYFLPTADQSVFPMVGAFLTVTLLLGVSSTHFSP